MNAIIQADQADQADQALPLHVKEVNFLVSVSIGDNLTVCWYTIKAKKLVVTKVIFCYRIEMK